MLDYHIVNHGSIFLFYPRTVRARRHLRASVQPNAQWWGDALVVEHRYALGLAEALREDGWTL